ncbi:MAG: AmmeMemoRadiSam system protein B [Chloroflexi bacterium]|nr:AmmeMemoRadiSam system protein B [Chloroflexota bacterium]
MKVRKPIVSGTFYPADKHSCLQQIEGYLAQVPELDTSRPLLAALVPHAGWYYSGATAAWVYRTLQSQPAPDTVILLGAVHRWGVAGATIAAADAWQTPIGLADIDDSLRTELLAAGNGSILIDDAAHAEDHAIEVQLPFVQVSAPAACILPIAVPPDARALQLGRLLGKVVSTSRKNAVVLASSDLTHYGPNYGMAPAGTGQAGLEWAHRNDQQFLERAVAMDAEGVLEAADRTRSACGAGALAAAITYAQQLGARAGQLLYYTTSYEVHPRGQPSDLVGYAAMHYG